MRFERLPRDFFLNVDGLHRQSSYGKLPGLLELTTIHLQWTQDRKKAPAVRVAHPEVTSSASKLESQMDALILGVNVLTRTRTWGQNVFGRRGLRDKFIS
ncbi:hypothetical protein EDB86DRAFT_2924903 [Lactarius hatsudake]|nr:hypothetical protein EDB86DRAFT_2924903 [Lactarius hatsudake]